MIEAIREVERLAEVETTRKRKDSVKRRADMKKAMGEAEKEAAKLKAKSDKKRAKDEEARRKREAEEADIASRRDGFKKNIAQWETLSRREADTVTV